MLIKWVGQENVIHIMKDQNLSKFSHHWIKCFIYIILHIIMLLFIPCDRTFHCYQFIYCWLLKVGIENIKCSLSSGHRGIEKKPSFKSSIIMKCPWGVMLGTGNSGWSSIYAPDIMQQLKFVLCLLSITKKIWEF